MKTPYYVIEFRSGSFFRDLESDHGCAIADARRFDTRAEAERFMDQHEWILFNGGMVLQIEETTTTGTRFIESTTVEKTASGSELTTFQLTAEGRRALTVEKERAMSLSDRDKTPNPSGWGYTFHHADPQRRVPCVLGDMLAPRSADDIPPITPEAMASVQAAMKLLADLVADRDFNLYMGCSDAKREEHRLKARDILLAAKSLAGILRVKAAP